MNAKKIIILAGVAVLIYALIVYPVQLANGVQAGIGWLTASVKSAVTFMDTVFS